MKKLIYFFVLAPIFSFSILFSISLSAKTLNSTGTINGFSLVHCAVDFCYELLAPKAYQGGLSSIYVFSEGRLNIFKRDTKGEKNTLIRTEYGRDGGYFDPVKSKIVLRKLDLKQKKQHKVGDAILLMNRQQLTYY